MKNIYIMVPVAFNLTKKDFKGQKGLFKLNYLCVG